MSIGFMLNILFLAMLGIALIAPPILLSKHADRMSWRVRYTLSVFPAAYTLAGWQLAKVAHDYFGCQGGMKVHACKVIGGIDPTSLVDYLFFLMIPFMFVAAPLSIWLLLNTGAKHIGAWHRRRWPTDEPKRE